MKLLKWALSLDGTKVKANALATAPCRMATLNSWKSSSKGSRVFAGAGRTSRPPGCRTGWRRGNCSAPGTTGSRRQPRSRSRNEPRHASRKNRPSTRPSWRIANRRPRKAAARRRRPVAGPKAQDQLNLTDGESRIMPVAGDDFEQAYNAQAAVDTSSMLVVSLTVTQACKTRNR